MKILVAYFSASGITASVAKEVASAANADLYEIKPGVRYTSADLNWMDKKSRSSVEMSNPASRPEIVKDLPDLSQYDTCLLYTSKHWGFQSGADIDKALGIPFKRSANQIIYLPEETNAYLSANVVSATDLGTCLLYTSRCV